MAQLALWTFNTGTPFALNTTYTATVDAVPGTPTLRMLGGATFTPAGVTGTAYNDGATAHIAGTAASWAGSGTIAALNSAEMVLSTSTVGASGLSLRFDYKVPAGGTTRFDVLYSLDGTRWVRQINNQTITADDTWRVATVNLAGVTALDQRDRVFIAIGDPSANGVLSIDNVELQATIAATNAPRAINLPSGIASDRLDTGDVARVRGITFRLEDTDTAATALTVTATSSNQTVVPNANLRITGTGADRTLFVDAAAVGNATITLTIGDGATTTQRTIAFAASSIGTNSATVSTSFLSGAADLSASALVNGQLITANDEDQMIRVYDPARSGAPVAEIPLMPIGPAPGRAPLALADSGDGIVRELDIEGVTVVGTRIWWIGSHANSATGADRPNRERLFATDVAGTGANTTLTSAGYYRFLEDDLVAWDTGNTHGRGANFFGINASQAATVVPEATNGFNIEGLTTSPDGNALWVAFRAPIEPAAARTNALIVPVTNFTTIINATGGTTGSATFGTAIELNLGGRGIRSIERAADGLYLIVAGPAGAAGAAPNDFRLYTWNGLPASAPVLRPVDLSGVLNGGSIEGIASLPGSLGSDALVQLVLDNGDSNFYADGVLNKDRVEPEQRKSTLVTLRLDGSPVVTPPEPTPQPAATFGSAGSVAMPAGSFVELAATSGTQTTATTRALLDGAATRLGSDTAEAAGLRSLVAGLIDSTAGSTIDLLDMTPRTTSGAPGTTTITGGAGTDAVLFAGDLLPAGSQVVLANVEFAMVSGRVTVMSDNRAVRIAGDEQAQRFEAGSAADSISAGGGNDTVLAGGGDDQVTPGRGNDIVDGGAGSDTAVIAAARGATTQRSFGLFTEVTSADGVDRLVRVETLVFSSGERQTLSPVAPFANLDGAGAQGTVARGGFDAAFYFARNPDVLAALPAGSTADAAFQFARGHYSQFGWREGRDPNTLFVTTSYLATNTDVRAAAIDPLAHFTGFGWREGRGSSGLDTAAYLTTHADVRLAGVDPMSHLFAFGFGEGRAF